MSLISRMPDYSTYSIQELHGVLETIDKGEYPDRYAIAQSEFRKKGEERLLTTGLQWYDVLPTKSRVDRPARIAGWIMLLTGLVTSLGLIAIGSKGSQLLMIVGAVLLIRPLTGLLLILKRRSLMMVGLVVQLLAIGGASAVAPLVAKAAGAKPGPGILLTVGTVFGVLSLLFLVAAWMRSISLTRFERNRAMMVGGN